MAVEFPPSLGARIADEIRVAQAPTDRQRNPSPDATVWIDEHTDLRWNENAPLGPHRILYAGRHQLIVGTPEGFAALARAVTRQLVTDALDGPDAA